MIVSLRGRIIDRATDSVSVDVGGVGYLVQMTPRAAAKLPLGDDEVTIPVHLVIREDQWLLFGFSSRLEQTLFTRLTTVSGLGPRLAISALQTFEATDLITNIVAADHKALTQIPGIGKKLSQRVILELSEKLQKDPVLLSVAAAEPKASQAQSWGSDLHQALAGLGYTPAQVAWVMEKLKSEDVDESDLNQSIKIALKLLRKS